MNKGKATDSKRETKREKTRSDQKDPWSHSYYDRSLALVGGPQANGVHRGNKAHIISAPFLHLLCPHLVRGRLFNYTHHFCLHTWRGRVGRFTLI